MIYFCLALISCPLEFSCVPKEEQWMDVSCSRCVQAFLQNLSLGVEVKLLTQDILSYLAKVFFMGFDNFKEFRQHPNFTGVAVYFVSSAHGDEVP